MIGQRGAEPGLDGSGGVAGGKGAAKMVGSTVKQLEAVVVGGAREGVHLDVGDGRGAVDSAAEVVQSEVEGDAYELTLRGARCAGKVEKGSEAERWVESHGAGFGDGFTGLGELSVAVGVSGNREDDYSGSGRDEDGGEEEKEKEVAAECRLGRWIIVHRSRSRASLL